MATRTPTAAARTRAAAKTTAKETSARSLQLATADQDARIADAGKVEEKDDGKLRVALKDEKFVLRTDVGVMAMMEWAASGDGQGEAEATGSYLKAVYHVLQSLVAEDEFARFRAYARDTAATLRELIEFQDAAFEAIAATPTKAQES